MGTVDCSVAFSLRRGTKDLLKKDHDTIRQFRTLSPGEYDDDDLFLTERSGHSHFRSEIVIISLNSEIASIGLDLFPRAELQL